MTTLGRNIVNCVLRRNPIYRLIPRRCATNTAGLLQVDTEGGNVTAKENVTAVPLRGSAATKRAMRRRMGAEAEVKERNNYEKLNTVVSACTAEAYDMLSLESFLSSTFPKVTSIHGEVIHVEVAREGDIIVEAFFFEHGSFALWGPPTEVGPLMLRLKESIRPFEIDSHSSCETETLFFRTSFSNSFYTGMDGETIVVESPLDYDNLRLVRSKLAYSNGLVDSARLSVLEKSLEEYIEKVKPIPAAIAEGGKLTVGRAEVLRMTGKLLEFRAQLNLHSELTDTPEMYWSEPQLEDIYHKVSRVLDIRQRANVLNRRLDYANELASILRSHLSERHGLKLEWGIIALIAVEVAFETLHLFGSV